jgi:hypothetical protein
MDSRPIKQTIRRRRRCRDTKCHFRFTTYEIIAPQMTYGQLPLAQLRSAMAEVFKTMRAAEDALGVIESLLKLPRHGGDRE